MSLFQALLYFVREAGVSLARSWKISLLAIATIAVSLFLSGVFLLLSGNLRSLVRGWQDESAIAVYFEKDAVIAAQELLAEKVSEKSWVSEVTTVTAQEAEQRFREAFPSLGDLLEGWDDTPLPTSLEVKLDWSQIDQQELAEWMSALSGENGVQMVDDDRDWLSQIEAIVVALEILGMVLGLILLATAVFTISSVIRLTAYLYRDEIAVMRLVGATEFFIRGPFYMEGLFQGLAGGLLAVTSLAGAHSFLAERYAGATLNILTDRFLSLWELLALVTLGAAAGLVGAISSLRREDLGQTAESMALDS